MLASGAAAESIATAEAIPDGRGSDGRSVIMKQWLQVTVKANSNTPLAADGVFYLLARSDSEIGVNQILNLFLPPAGVGRNLAFGQHVLFERFEIVPAGFDFGADAVSQEP